MGQVVGKFIVSSVEDRGEVEAWDYSVGGTGKFPNVAVRLQAVTPETDEDFDTDSFYRSTPQGHVEMVIQNPDAAEQFQSGDKFYVRFERIPRKEQTHSDVSNA